MGSTSLERSMTLALVLLMVAMAGASTLEAQVPTRDVQVAGAVKAAPPGAGDDATVLGFTSDGSLTTIREGTNDLICLADDPNREGWSVACYHESLEPYMARGRELRAEGLTDAGELAQRRWDEADAGDLAMPEAPSALYVLTGSHFDADADAVVDSYLRWVIYTPWATTESTGLSPRPTALGAPWLMFPGTAGAHVMISPPQPETGGSDGP